MREFQHESDACPEGAVNMRVRPREWHLNTTPADDTPGDCSLYVITFCTASRQMALRVRFVNELAGLSVFRSRTVEHGRERFRMHLAYFESAARAQHTLAIVRRYFPNAWISAAPRNNLMRESCLDVRDLRSVDDTMNTAFSAIRPVTPRGVTSKDIALPLSAAATATAGQPRLISLPPAAGPQCYVVQLDWSPTPISSATIPRIAEFRAYNLYRVRTVRDGRPQHGLRLGFFPSVDGARQVAEHVRAHYPRVSVVLASHREYACAFELMQRFVGKAAASSAPADRPGARLPDAVSRQARSRRAGVAMSGA